MIRARKRKPVAVRAVAVDSPIRLVTLEDPSADVEPARDAFARLRPPEGFSPEAVEAWRARVAKVARGVKVLPAPRADDVPLALTRVGADAAGSIREESERLARETGRPDVELLVGKLLDEVGA